MSLIRASAHQLPLVDGCVQCCVTSPPYWGLRDYGVPPLVWGDGWTGCLGLEPTPDLYVAHLVEVFAEVRRALKPDGVLWVNLGDSYASGAANGGQSDFSSSGLKRDGRPEESRVRTLTQNAKELHRKQPAQRLDPGLKPKDLVGIPWRVAFALRAAGWYLRSDVIWSKPNPMPESVTDRPTKAHEYLFLLAKSERYFYDADAIREANTPGTIARLLSGPVQAKAAQSKNIIRRDGGGEYAEADGRNKRSVWTVATKPYHDAHFATFPPALVEPCILAGSRVGDLVLDPFIGSGTVGAVCDRLMRRWVGVDLNYQHLSKKRTRQRGLRVVEASA